MPLTMETKDIITAVFGAAVSLSGILLVFIGFVYVHAETFDLERLRTRYKLAAKFGMVPFLASLGCATIGLQWMLCPSINLFIWTRNLFYVCLGLTAMYGIVAFIFYL